LEISVTTVSSVLRNWAVLHLLSMMVKYVLIRLCVPDVVYVLMYAIMEQ